MMQKNSAPSCHATVLGIGEKIGESEDQLDEFMWMRNKEV